MALHSERKPQLFGRGWNAVLPGAGALLLLAIGAGAYGWYALARSDYVTHTNFAVDQPVMFSHRHHVSELGLDCRYCHSHAEDGPVAGLPATEVCMTCHSQVFSDSPMLEPVRQSFVTGRPITWRRVYDLPDHVFFNHRVHVRAGLDCAQCHSGMENMVLAARSQPLFMSWCLDCHRHPTAGRAQTTESGDDRLFPYPDPLTDCHICHR